MSATHGSPGNIGQQTGSGDAIETSTNHWTDTAHCAVALGKAAAGNEGGLASHAEQALLPVPGVVCNDGGGGRERDPWMSES